MIASNIIDMESTRLNRLWTELIHDELRTWEIKIDSNTLPIRQSFEITSNGKYSVDLTDQQIKAKLERYQDLIFAWKPLMYDLQFRINADLYIALFDPDGFCISFLDNTTIGMQCSAAPYLYEIIQQGAPIKVQINQNHFQSDPSDNMAKDFAIKRHNALIFPISDEDNNVLGYIGVGNFNGIIPDEICLIGYVAARILELKYSNIHTLKKYSSLLINGLPMCALLVDENGRIISGNDQFHNLLGISENDISSIAVSFLSKSSGSDNLFKNDIPNMREKFNIKTASNQIIPCDMMSRHLISMPGYQQHFLVLFQKNEMSFWFDSNPLDNHSLGSAFNRLIGTTPKITNVKVLAEKVSRMPSNVLIEGVSGTGKELLAEAIHLESMRKGPFIPINCGAIPKELMLSELFGYEDGAFTGAKKGGKKGVFEIADGGTVFLDEIGEMPIDMQVSLLRFLESRTIMRIGSGESKKVDVRIIAATNRNLNKEVSSGNFREDLYYRLNVFTIKMPTLLERLEDIPIIVQHLLEKLCRDMTIKQPCVNESFMNILLNHDWPGNVRELRNVIEYALIVSQGEEITEVCLPVYLQQKYFNDKISGSLEVNEKSLIIEALEQFNGDVTKSASYLGIARQTLYRKMSKMDINRQNYINKKKYSI